MDGAISEVAGIVTTMVAIEGYRAPIAGHEVTEVHRSIEKGAGIRCCLPTWYLLGQLLRQSVPSPVRRVVNREWRCIVVTVWVSVGVPYLLPNRWGKLCCQQLASLAVV